ncbi:MAG: right-handed parallel beta-helix repeat-containing protein [Candidatus Helarchaeota archaeon]
MDETIKDTIIEILTNKWLTKPEIFEKLPRFNSMEAVRAVNEFLESKIKEGIILKRFNERRIMYGIFEIKPPQPDEDIQEVEQSTISQPTKQKDWSEAELRVKIGKTVYIESNDEKKIKVIPEKKKSDTFLLTIDGNEDFKNKALKNKWNGNGIEDDPYIITNLSFDGGSKNDGLCIKNTNLYFILYDCTIRHCKAYGILFENVKNGIIKQNRVVLNNFKGIILRNSSEIIITNNFILNNLIGIDLENSNLNKIENNEINTNSQIGIKLQNSSQNILDNNLNSYNGIGFDLKESNENTIKNNEIKSNKGQGIYLLDCFENQFIDNILLRNSSGIELVNSIKNIIKKNQVKFNRNDGISLFNSIQNIIEENQSIKNKCGIYLDRCSGNIIRENVIESNIEESVYLIESFENEII